MQAKHGIILLLVAVAAVYTLYTPSNENDTLANVLPEYYWFNEVTGKTQWEEPIYEYESEDGETYWIDPDTGKATWDKPESLGWILAEEEGGKMQVSKLYYWNDVTEASQWEKPANLGWHKVKYVAPSETEGGAGDEPDNSEL